MPDGVRHPCFPSLLSTSGPVSPPPDNSLPLSAAEGHAADGVVAAAPVMPAGCRNVAHGDPPACCRRAAGAGPRTGPECPPVSGTTAGISRPDQRAGGRASGQQAARQTRSDSTARPPDAHGLPPRLPVPVANRLFAYPTTRRLPIHAEARHSSPGPPCVRSIFQRVGLTFPLSTLVDPVPSSPHLQVSDLVSNLAPEPVIRRAALQVPVTFQRSPGNSEQIADLLRRQIAFLKPERQTGPAISRYHGTTFRGSLPPRVLRVGRGVPECHRGNRCQLNLAGTRL